jgi:type IV pilus assembly protein PilA
MDTIRAARGMTNAEGDGTMLRSRTTRRRFVRGFTLIELLIVVAMIGVLAALAIAGYRKYIYSAGSSEATAMLGSIRAAQEAYKAEALSYLPVSGTDGGDLSNLYPRAAAALDDRKVGWGGGSDAVADNWRILNASPDGAVRFSYACVAGLPGSTPPGASGFGEPDPSWANAYGGGDAPEPWFVAIAVGDRDDDGQYAVLATSSFSSEVLVHDDTE